VTATGVPKLRRTERSSTLKSSSWLDQPGALLPPRPLTLATFSACFVSVSPDAATDQKRRRAKTEARQILERVASKDSTITYSQLASRITAMRYAPNGDPFSELLCDISRATHAQGRGLLSAVVVHVDDERPGNGFFALVESLGYDATDKESAWQREIAKVHAIWAES
jgi:hypothetical protein